MAKTEKGHGNAVIETFVVCWCWWGWRHGRVSKPWVKITQVNRTNIA